MVINADFWRRLWEPVWGPTGSGCAERKWADGPCKSN